MSKNIFQLDWIFIDIFIILFLFLLLCAVKIIKNTYRWRRSFSNEALELLSFSNDQTFLKNKFISTINWSLTRNHIHKKEKLSIIILRNYEKKKLSGIITEGLSSNGFNVINLKIKLKRSQISEKLSKTSRIEIKKFIPSILDYLKIKKLIINTNYFIISFLKFKLPFNIIFSDSNNMGITLINPKFDSRSIKKFHNLINLSINSKPFYIIFCGKNINFIRNHNLNRYLNEFKEYFHDKLKVIKLEKAKNSCKYYETVVLGMIIDIIENELPF